MVPPCFLHPNTCLIPDQIVTLLRAPVGSSLAYIGTASGTTQRDAPEAYARRFRLGDKKEAAGVCRGRGDQPEMYGY